MRAQSHNLLDVTPRISPLNDGSIHPLRPVNNVFFDDDRERKKKHAIKNSKISTVNNTRRLLEIGKYMDIIVPCKAYIYNVS